MGAIDGKHCVIQKPANSGSLYLNYKGTFSVVLMAISDANYKFVSVEVGSYGKQSDGGIFSSSKLGQFLKQGECVECSNFVHIICYFTSPNEFVRFNRRQTENLTRSHFLQRR